MQEFFMDYGLWLLVALLVVIALVFLLSGKKKTDASAEPIAPVEAPPVPVTVPPMVEPAAIVPVEKAADATLIAPVAPEPAVELASAPVPIVEPEAPLVSVTTPDAEGDDLLKLKGVGPKLKALLIDLGVTRFDQIAAWTDGDVAEVDAKLGNFKGRPVRDHWIDQAKYLAAGDIAGFEAKYGKL